MTMRTSLRAGRSSRRDSRANFLPGLPFAKPRCRRERCVGVRRLTPTYCYYFDPCDPPRRKSWSGSSAACWSVPSSYPRKWRWSERSGRSTRTYRCRSHSTGAVVRQGNLSESDGARLLHQLGVRRAGAATITPDDAELKQASLEVHGHALTLSLLGSYLAQAHEGDIRQCDKVEFEDADDATRGGYAFKVMAAYEKWFQREGVQGARDLAALRLLGYFDRPADADCLTALREAPPISGLTEPLLDLSTAQWNITVSRLKACGLIEAAPATPPTATQPAIDAHPLVREYAS